MATINDAEVIAKMPDALTDTLPESKWEKIISVTEKTIIWLFQMCLLAHSLLKH